jgi:hypothetical protein
MKNPWIVLPLAAASLMIIFLPGGCAPKAQGLRDNGPATAVRPPPSNSVDVRLLSEKPEVPPRPPYSVADEIRGRWLTLFEVTISPISAGTLPGSGSAIHPGTHAPGPAPNP